MEKQKTGKTFEFEDSKYLTLITFGPGLNFSFRKSFKSPEENLEYRKQHKLDIYDNFTKIGECNRDFTRWNCYILIDKTKNFTINMPAELDYLIELDNINKFIQEKKLFLPKIDSIVTTHSGCFYHWIHQKNGFFLTDEVHHEIKLMASLISEYRKKIIF